MRANYPDASEREMFLRCAALRLRRHLMMAAYGWDPEREFARKSAARVAGRWPLPLKLSAACSSFRPGLKLLMPLEARPPLPLVTFRSGARSEIRSDRCSGGGVKHRILYRPRYDPRGVCPRPSRKPHSFENGLEIRLFPLRHMDTNDVYSRTEFDRRVFGEIRPDGREAIECAVASATFGAKRTNG